MTRMIRPALLLFSVAAAITVAACGDDGDAREPASLVRVDPEPDGANCPGGGVAIHTGRDTDDDTYLDDPEITSTQYVCNGDTFVQCAGGQIAEGTITIRAPADLAQLTGVNCIDGDLLIAGTDLDALPPLPDLEIVTGAVVIAGNRALTSLDGLAALREIGRSYLIQSNASLVDVAALGGLRRADTISIVGNDALVDLAGLETWVDVHWGLIVTSNGQLASLRGLDNLASSTRTITLRGNRSLRSLDALDALRSVVLLDIAANTVLEEVSLASLEKIDGRLLVTVNPALQRVDLPALSTIGDFVRFEGDAALATIRLTGLLTAGGVLLNNNTSLTALDAPSLVFSTGAVELINVPALVSAQLGELASVGGGLTINNAPALGSLAGFAQLGSIGGALLVNNSGLPSFAGLDALGIVAGDLTITQNSRLTSLAGLDALREVGQDLRVSNNSMLPLADAQAFAAGVNVQGEVIVAP